MNISQSLIKAFEEYTLEKYCGGLFKAMYIDKSVTIEPTPAMKMGLWFEYMVTGQKMRGDIIPLPELLKKGDPAIWSETKIPPIEEKLPQIFFDNYNFLTSKYKYLYKQAIYCRKTFKYYNITNIQSGIVWEYKTEKGNNTKCILDVFAERNGKQIIIDLKATGFIDNKWEDWGWDDDTLSQKYKLMLQPIHYKWTGIKLFNKDIPFYFFVHSSTNSIDRKIFKVDVSENTMKRYDGVDLGQSKVDYIADMIKFNLEIGFDNYPNVKRCSECPLKDECPDFIDIPRIRKIMV